MLRLRVRKREWREEIYVARTDNPIMPARNILAGGKWSWAALLRFWDQPLVRTQK